MSGIQYRYISDAEVRADVKNRQISGYGIVFNSDSQPLTIYDTDNGFVRVVEQITQRSIEEADLSDVVSAFNHNFEKILGRTSSNTMNLSFDDRGVKYIVRAGNQSYATDLLESLKRGDVSGSSFVFTYDFEEGYDIQDREDGTIVAIPNKITKVYEMGPVVNPAYLDTTAENRSSAIEDAVKRHLAEKKKTEPETPEADQVQHRADKTQPEREEEPIESDIQLPAEPVEVEQKRSFPSGYYSMKAKIKKRV